MLKSFCAEYRPRSNMSKLTSMMRKPLVVLVATIIFSPIIGLLATSPQKICDMSRCKGPLKFYEEINCEPVKTNPGDCCPFRYDCPHLSATRSQDKCYVNDNVYSDGEDLKGEDRAYRCDECKCLKRDEHGIAQFECVVDSGIMGHISPAKPKEGCYMREHFMECTVAQEICPEKPEDRPKCEVDGKTYLDGESFTPANSPHLSCQCAEGYKGENVVPFCRRKKCGLEFRHYTTLKRNCAPVYHSDQPLHTSCFPYGSYRCQNERDEIIAPEGPASDPRKVPDEEKCKFGNLTMFIGERLNTATHYDSVCVECTCEVPPVPTCVRLPEDKCDITKHPEFTF